MEAYCDKQGISMNSIRFMFDEKRLKADQTAEQVLLRSLNFHLQNLTSVVWPRK